MIEKNIAPSRRDVMRAFAVVPALVAPALANAATGIIGTPAGPSLEMAKAVAAYHSAAAFENEWHDRAYAPVWKICSAEVETIPHLTTQTRHERGGKLVQWSTDNLADQTEARWCRKHLDEGGSLTASYRQLLEEFEEKIELRLSDKRRIEQRHGMGALDEEQDRLVDISYRAMRVVETFPAATVPDLIAKVQFAEETEGRIEPDELLVDLRRIAGEVRS